MKRAPFFLGMIIGIVITGLISIGLFGFFAFERIAGQVIDVPTEIVEYEDFGDKIDAIDEIIDATYYETYEQNEMWEGAYEGYVSGIGDPYTSYFTKEQFDAFMESTAGSYEGIGVVVSFGENGEDVLVVAPFAGSPGEKAGVLPEDQILKVDGLDITGLTLEEIVKEIKGPKGTDVVLNVYRKSTDQILDITITRDVINQETVAYEMLDNDIGYIALSGFEQVTYDQFMEAYNALEEQGQKGMIIDVRNNPGGLVSIVSKIADQLLPEGLIVYTEDKNGEREEIKSDSKNQFTKPLAVLVNGYSASASEILSGAIKDYGIGTLVGTTTFGKGLVQSTFPLEDGSAVKVTIAKYYTPNGNYIHEVGIEPDIVVELPEEFKYTYHVEKDKDTQLQKAIEVVGSEIQ